MFRSIHTYIQIKRQQRTSLFVIRILIWLVMRKLSVIKNGLIDDGKFDQIFDAILDDHIHLIKDAISNGFTGLSKSSTGDMALHFACLNSNLDCISLLLGTLKDGEIDTLNIETDDTICGTALHMSMDGQVCVEVVHMLLESGANPNAKDVKGSPVLHELIYRAFEDCGEKFQSEDSMWEDDNECTDEESETISDNQQAVKCGDSYLLKLKVLHDYGADMNIINEETGLSALHFWCQNCNWSFENYTEESLPDWYQIFFQSFIEFGADMSAENKRGETALVYLTQRYYKPYHNAFIQSYKLFNESFVSLLTDRDTKKRNMFGRTLLHCAVEHSNYVLVDQLLTIDTGVNVRDKFGLSPIHIATHNLANDEADFVKDIITCLSTHGGNVNIQDNEGSTPLHHAIQLNNYTAVQTLLNLGASLDICDGLNRNPKHIAELYGNPVIRSLLGSSTPIDCDSLFPVSDSRYGWFFPHCCHKRYNLDNRGIEEQEKVKESKIKSWLKKYPMCCHNMKTVLQNSIAALGSDREQLQCDENHSVEARRELYEMALRMATEIGEINPLFKSNVIFGGSVSEGTKVGSCDEFDFVFDLFKIRELVEVEECEDNLRGFAKLKVKDRDYFTKMDAIELVDECGYLKRLETSNKFHKYLEKTTMMKSVWESNRFLAFWGTTNALGECFNIGQLHLVWYGPTLKRQDVNVDIAPVIRVTDWQSKNFRSDVRLIDSAIALKTGCYLVMKDPTPYLEKHGFFNSEDEDSLYKLCGCLFKISISQIEHAVMKSLPTASRHGYTLAKSIQLQCPHILFNLMECLVVPKDEPRAMFQDTDGTIMGIVPIWEYLTSYVINYYYTGLFYELHEREIRLNILENDFKHQTWNENVLKSSMFYEEAPRKQELTEVTEWALRIYRRVLALVTETKRLPEYFLPHMEATKIPGGSNAFVKIISTFLYTLIQLLEQLKQYESMSNEVIYTRVRNP